MTKKIISFFFSVVFISLIVCPTIYCLFDDSIDVSYIYSLNEDEEKSGKESSNIKVVLHNLQNFLDDQIEIIPKFNFANNYWFYANPLKIIISPPPELI
ncbi:MAG: hypothetical protein WBN28_13010 [Lutimonas sp.]